jgi:hypothetical protein
VAAMRAQQNPKEQQYALRRLNQDMYALAMRDSWLDLRVKITVSGTSAQLPSDLIGIDLVWDDQNGIEFLHRNRSTPALQDEAYRYVLYPAGNPLAVVKDAALQQDGTGLSSPDLEAALGEDAVGEYFVVNGEQQVYRIESLNNGHYTFTPGYRGAGSSSSNTLTVRPVGTQLIELEGPHGTHLPTAEFDLHYWRMPTMLRDPHDVVPFPTADVLTFRAISRIPAARQLRPISQAQVDAALSEALALNPDKPKPRLLQDLGGRRVDFNHSFYAPRHAVMDRGEQLVTRWKQC